MIHVTWDELSAYVQHLYAVRTDLRKVSFGDDGYVSYSARCVGGDEVTYRHGTMPVSLVRQWIDAQREQVNAEAIRRATWNDMEGT